MALEQRSPRVLYLYSLQHPGNKTLLDEGGRGKTNTGIRFNDFMRLVTMTTDHASRPVLVDIPTALMINPLGDLRALRIHASLSTSRLFALP